MGDRSHSVATLLGFTHRRIAPPGRLGKSAPGEYSFPPPGSGRLAHPREQLLKSVAGYEKGDSERYDKYI